MRELHDALKKVGVTVFLDERDIRFAHSITRDIEDAMRRSMTMLLYYSESFVNRSACQFELHHAYLSALRTGEVERRILVINPDDPQIDHLMPLEMRAHRYWRTWSSKAELARLVDQLRQAVRQVDTPFSGIDFAARATTRQTSRDGGTVAFVGRYRDRWQIHSALHRGEQPLVETVTAPPVAALTGMTGIGKSSLVQVYVHDFGFLYQGGVYRITLTRAGGSPELVRSTHTEQLLQLADSLGESVPDRSRPAVLAWWARRLELAGAPVLWVVDDVPGNLASDVLHELTPHAPDVRVLLIGQHAFPREFAQPVRLGPMTPDDGHELFTRDHPVASTETNAVDEVVRRLGGHPFAILLAAARARSREGLWRIQERMEHLTTDSSILGTAMRTVRHAIADLVGAKRVILGLSAVCSAGPLPATLIRDVLEALAPAEHEQTNVVLAQLDQAMLVEHQHRSWQIHQLVREAARQTLSEGELNTIAAVAAHKLMALAENGDKGLAEHAVALLDRTDGSPTYAVGLNTLAANHYESRGEPALAAHRYESLAALHPDDYDYLFKAARACQAAGHPDKALAHLDRLDECPIDDLTALSAAAVRAAALDDKGKYLEAEAAWARIVNHPRLPAMPATEQIAIRTAHLHNRRLLGHFTEARTLGQRLVTEMNDPALAEALIPLRLELAAIDLATEDQQGARALLQEILDHYHRRELPGHVNAVEAATLLYEGQLSVFILAKGPNLEVLANSATELRHQLTTARRDFGPHNVRTLAIAVRYMTVLVGLGDPDRVLRECSRLPQELAEDLGNEHRLHLRAVFLLGQAFSQRGDHAQAADAYRRALVGQQASLGPGHPETLMTTYELGVCQWREGDRDAAQAAFRTVMKDAVEKVGRRNDLYGKAWTASTLSSFMPSPVFRAMEALDRLWRKS